LTGDSASNSVNVKDARARIGAVWGLDRDITKAELARALRLSPENGGDYVGRLEKGANMSGPVQVAIMALMSGFKPDNMGDVIKPGYPRGPVR
jgi:hypothetical protein